MKTTADILREHEGINKTDYVGRDRELLQRWMDGYYKEGLNKEGDFYRKAIVDLDKKFDVNEPIDRLPATLVKLDLKTGKVLEIQK